MQNRTAVARVEGVPQLGGTANPSTPAGGRTPERGLRELSPQPSGLPSGFGRVVLSATATSRVVRFGGINHSYRRGGPFGESAEANDVDEQAGQPASTVASDMQGES